MLYSTIDQKWLSEPYLQGVRRCFDLVRDYLPTPPKRILDIGCGFAQCSQLFQEQYGSELYLLEGSSEMNTATQRKSKFGPADTFKFYWPMDYLHNQWTSQGLKYTHVSAHLPQIDPTVKFDLVCSWLSCGYHYPADTYRDLILAHTHEQSVVIMDFRTKCMRQQAHSIHSIHVLENAGKRSKIHFSFR
jgi:SAM-dependent methyltransferase